VTRALAAALIAFAALVAEVGAVEPGEMLTDPRLEARARELSRELRCLVCQNQSIDDSAAPLARDLRILVRERLAAGDSDDQVIAFVTDRYGDFVRLRPPFKPETWLLWLGTPALLLAAAGSVILVARRRRVAAEAPGPLSAAERSRLDAALGEGP
jgi:cytochrome c-type biogenesis protein CcmH